MLDVPYLDFCEPNMHVSGFKGFRLNVIIKNIVNVTIHVYLKINLIHEL